MENLEYTIREAIGFGYSEVSLEWQPRSKPKIENSIYNFGALLVANELSDHSQHKNMNKPDTTII